MDIARLDRAKKDSKSDSLVDVQHTLHFSGFLYFVAMVAESVVSSEIAPRSQEGNSPFNYEYLYSKIN